MVKGCGDNLIKYTLFAFNFAFVILGILIFAFGVVLKVQIDKISEVAEQTPDAAAIFVIIIGVAVFVIAFFGCCGAIKENKCMLTLFSVIIMVLFICEIIAAVLSLVYTNEVTSMSQKILKKLMDNYDLSDPKKTATFIMDRMQWQLECCGADGPNDWRYGLPNSCCNDPLSLEARKTCNTETSFKEGCKKSLEDTMKLSLNLIAGFTIVLAIVHLISIFFACKLAHSLE